MIVPIILYFRLLYAIAKGANLTISYKLNIQLVNEWLFWSVYIGY